MQADTLDQRNMVADFSDIKRIVKSWIDRELDHKMILRRDDPLADALRRLGEPVFLLDLWEHAYLHDFGVKGRPQWVEAVLDNIDWKVIDARCT